MIRLAALPVLLGLLGCATPGRDIAPEPGDFALIEIQLRG